MALLGLGVRTTVTPGEAVLGVTALASAYDGSRLFAAVGGDVARIDLTGADEVARKGTVRGLDQGATVLALATSQASPSEVLAVVQGDAGDGASPRYRLDLLAVDVDGDSIGWHASLETGDEPFAGDWHVAATRDGGYVLVAQAGAGAVRMFETAGGSELVPALEVPAGVSDLAMLGREHQDVCDGADDDCDGETDEGFGVGEECPAVGVCGAGLVECGGPLATRCSTGPGGSASEAADVEECNGLDDDCDGAVDEAIPVVVPDPRRLTSAQGSVQAHALAWAPGEEGEPGRYGLAWTEQREGSTQLYFARFAPGGEPVGAELQLTQPEGGDVSGPEIGWDGQAWGIVYSAPHEAHGAVYFTRISPDPDEGRSTTLVSESERDADMPALAVGDGEWAVTWRQVAGDEPPVWGQHFRKLDRQGELVGGESQGVNKRDMPAQTIIWNGTGYMGFSSLTHNLVYGPQLFAHRFEGEGGPHTQVMGDFSSSLRGAWVAPASQYVLARGAREEARLTWVAADGIGGGGEVVFGPQYVQGRLPDVAWTGGEYGVVWDDARDERRAVWFERVAADHTPVGDDHKLGGDPGEASHARIVLAGWAYGIAWRDTRGDTPQVYFVESGFGCPSLGP